MDPSTSLSPTSRSAHLERFESQRFDLLVIGGGITGAGIARDAAFRGLSVALVEADDFAAGTSSRSSKLIHGGLRYLAMGDVGLVRETALERKAVHAMAPHLAEPCWMVVPARGRAAMLKFRAGIGTYEKLGAVEDADRHHVWNADQLAQHEPVLKRGTYEYGVAYREYLTDDARLVLGVLRAAAADHAVVANHLPVTSLLKAGERVDGAIGTCGLTGADVAVRADAVVNAAGPWVEHLARMEDDPPLTRLHLSKGVHIVLPLDRLPVENLVILQTKDKRSIFAIPRGDTVAIGTTDTSYRGHSILWPEIDEDDVRYLLEPIPRYFDVEPPTAADVTAAWSGVRPLVDRGDKEPKEMSRKDEIWTGSGGMINIAGGKLTGFRLMAENVVDIVARQLGRGDQVGPGDQTIPGGNIDSDLSAGANAVASSAKVRPDVAHRLLRLYGSDTRDVLALGSRPIVADGLVVAGEIEWAIDVEAAHSLEDVIYRRTRAAWYVPEERDDLAVAAADRMAERLGWDGDRRDAELASVRRRFAQELAFSTGAS